MTATAIDTAAPTRAPDRNFKYWVIAPAIFLLLLVGLFPLIYTLIVSFQHLTMTEADTSFVGLKNYAHLFVDTRLWQSLLHTLIITVVALPLELIFGMLMAQLFLEPMPGRQVFVSLLVLPVVISPIVAGAIWRLLLDNRYGPINQILGWFAGQPVTLLWNINPNLVYPAIIFCEIWQWTPFMFLILLAALSNVDKSLTAGGPGTMTETISIYTYVQGFQQFETSYTAAIAFLVIALLTAVVTWAIRRMGLAK